MPSAPSRSTTTETAISWPDSRSCRTSSSSGGTVASSARSSSPRLGQAARAANAPPGWLGLTTAPSGSSSADRSSPARPTASVDGVASPAVRREVGEAALVAQRGERLGAGVGEHGLRRRCRRARHQRVERLVLARVDDEPAVALDHAPARRPMKPSGSVDRVRADRARRAVARPQPRGRAARARARPRQARPPERPDSRTRRCGMCASVTRASMRDLFGSPAAVPHRRL